MSSSSEKAHTIAGRVPINAKVDNWKSFHTKTGTYLVSESVKIGHSEVRS